MAPEVSPMRVARSYTISQAARLAGTTPQNVRRWLFGYAAPGHRMEPVFGSVPENDGPPIVSFLQLAEILVVARYRRRSGRQIKLQRLREAHRFARERLGIEWPFASESIVFEGGHIIHEFEEAHPAKGARRIAIDEGGKFILPLDFRDTLELFDFDLADTLATRFYPFGRNSPVVVDPEHAAGLPTFVGTNIRVDTIVSRWKSGQTIAELEEDFEIPSSAIEAVLQAA
ncbi:MAG: DUF433 domain-containing protein [Dehalococcoidia bacterium]|nr:DUF433 domain-containing protein [Dehalococcoidia bacterium]